MIDRCHGTHSPGLGLASTKSRTWLWFWVWGKVIPLRKALRGTPSSNHAGGGRGEEEAEHQDVGQAGDKNTVSNGMLRSRRLSQIACSA